MSVFKTWDLWRQAYTAAGYVDDEEQNMTTLREAAQQALEALENPWSAGPHGVADAITALRAALAEPVQEPVAHSVVAGALFDFMGWLTSRRERIVLSSADNASPAVEAIIEFAKMRGLSLDDAKVQDWNTSLRAALAEPPDSTKPVVERNFCQRCGKRTNDIHTCTPPLADGDNLSPTGCDHCRHVLYAAIKCSQCGRVTE